MSQYYERPFAERVGALGDQAEGAFLGVHPKAHRLGLSRPRLSVAKMQPNLRYTPDFLIEDAAYEVMGISSRGNGHLKLKLEKADALQAWSLLMPVHLWVYDSGRRRYWSAPISTWISACHKYSDKHFFPDNDRPYWSLHWSDFPAQPTPIVAAA
jgi:hypothetical protein